MPISDQHEHMGIDSNKVNWKNLKGLEGLAYDQGDVFYIDANSSFQRLGAGTSGQFLKTQGTGANPTWANPKNNLYSLELNGSTQYASNTSISALINPTGNFTVEVWFKLDTLLAGQVIVSNVVTDSNTYGPIYKITVNTNGSITGQTWDSGFSFLVLTSATGLVTTGVWYHVAFVKAAANDWTLYLGTIGSNDSSVATSSSSRTISGTGKTGIRIGADEGSIGSSTPSGSYFDGLVDEVRFWNTNLSLAVINANKEKELTGSETNLQIYHKLNNSYYDTTVNIFHLTASGSPTFNSATPF